MKRTELVARVKKAARMAWPIVERVAQHVSTRDIVVAAGALLLARGVARIAPGAGSITLGLVLLYIALWHGPLTAYLLRSSQPKE